MTDYSELKSAAEACEDLMPLRYMESYGALYIRNDCGIVFDVHQNRSFPEFMAHNKAYADLALAAKPAAVLALIAENEALKAQLAECAEFIDNAPGDYAEMEALSKNANRYQHIKSTWHDGGLIDRLAANVLPEDWDAVVDADMGKGN